MKNNIIINLLTKLKLFLTKNWFKLVVLASIVVIALFVFKYIKEKQTDEEIKKVIVDIDTTYSPSKQVINNHRDSIYVTTIDSALRVISGRK